MDRGFSIRRLAFIYFFVSIYLIQVSRFSFNVKRYKSLSVRVCPVVLTTIRTSNGTRSVEESR